MRISFKLSDTGETERAAKCFSEVLQPGDSLLLQGPVGAGKTDFARRLIQTRLGEFGIVEDVPSPTFTLVQCYDVGPAQIWHADLYRLTDVDELFELGLETAFDTSICLVEWPERLGDMARQDAMWLQLEICGETERNMHLFWKDAKWESAVRMLKLMLTEIETNND